METKVVIEIGAEHTRIRVFASARPQQTLLSAKLSSDPSHPRALQWLLEAMALWQGSPLHAVIAADESLDSYVTKHFPAWWGDFGGVLYTLDFVDKRSVRARRRERHEGELR